MYTQCPSCRTLFRISEQHLAAAKGKVRCGKCNHIYNAQGTLINELPQQAAPTTPTPETKPEPEVKPAAAPTTPQLHKFENFDHSSTPPMPAVEDSASDDNWQEPDFNIVVDNRTSSTEIEIKDDWRDIDLTTNTSDTSSVEEDDDDWLFGDDETEIPSVNHLQQNLDADDVQMVNLGTDSTFSSDLEDDEDDWLFSGDEKLPENTNDVDIVLGDEDEEDSNVDIVLRDEGEFVPEAISASIPEATPVEEAVPITEDEEDDSDFMHHMSDYLDDDQADELISDESAADILSEVNQQLNLAIANPDDKQQPSQGINLPGEWSDDFDQAIGSVAGNELDDEERERQELNDAILKGLETSSARQPATPKPAPEPKADVPNLSNATIGDELVDSSESIVLQATDELDIGHRIGQHDNVPLRIRDSIGIEEQQPRSGLKMLLISGAVLLLVLLLAIQAVLFRSVDLANKYPELQPTLVKLCENLPCRDSRPLNVEQIRLLSRNISQHPKTKSALLIKAVITNRANFAQRYPKIQITLSNLTGDTVAQRIFYPQEYLGTLYHPFLTMKPNTPVHIALEVVDPGSAAINFEFDFL